MKELYITAQIKNTARVLEFIEDGLAGTPLAESEKFKVIMAVEEIFVNVAHYAYSPDTGDVSIKYWYSDNPPSITIEVTDSGAPFNPLTNAEPNLTLPAEDRKIGGLGIFLVKKNMTYVESEYKNGQNILRMRMDF